MASDYLTYSRKCSVTTDEHGVDALKDKSYAQIANIKNYNFYVVTQSLRGRPDSISNIHYGNPNLWWVILYYNGISNFYDIREGLQLKIPALGDVIDIIAKNSSAVYKKQSRKVSI